MIDGAAGEVKQVKWSEVLFFFDCGDHSENRNVGVRPVVRCPVAVLTRRELC